MTSIAEWACLKQGRENFTVRPDVDAQFFFGREALREGIRRQLRYGLSVMGAPKMVIWGNYGAGKTHTLHHIQWHLDQEPNKGVCEIRIVKTPLLTKTSSFGVLHAKLVDSLGLEYVRDVMNLYMASSPGSWLDQLIDLVGDANVAHGLRGLTLFGTMQLTAWRWLMGEKVSDEDQLNLNITRGYRAPEDLVQILTGIGALVRQVQHRRLVYLIDELELLDAVTSAEAIDSFREAFRLLASDDNRNVGFVVASIRPVDEELGSSRVLLYASVFGRLGEENYIEISPLAPVSAREFVRDLLVELVDNGCATARHGEVGLFPFTTESLELLEQWITEDPSRQLPRQIIQALNNGAFAAWEANEGTVGGPTMARALGL